MSVKQHDTSVTADERVQELLTLYGDPNVSVPELLCDQHPADATAYVVVDQDMSRRVISYGELRLASSRFAAGLAELGVKQGDRVATLLGKRCEQLVAILGIWRLGAVHVPLFTAFAPPAVDMRLADSQAKVVICDETQRPKLSPRDDSPQTSWRVITVGEVAHEGDVRFADVLAPNPLPTPVRIGGDGPIVQIFTSGTTGRPKAVQVPAVALASFHAYMEFGLDLRDDDVFWNAADPGWAYGLYLGVHGSLCLGVPSVWLNAGFSPELTWGVLSQLGVTNFAAAPTVYRALRSSPPTTSPQLSLRCASAAGEPLTPEINEWATTTLGVRVHDHYGQTETGMLINNHHHPDLAKPPKAGSMGHAMPGWAGVILDNRRDELVPAGTAGRIAFDLRKCPLAWFSGYINETSKSSEKYTKDGRYYITGDSGTLDDDGYFRFVSRDDDIIIMAGYRISPLEVESVLQEHPMVVEAAVIGAPDKLRGEILEAYVVPRRNDIVDSELEHELKELVRRKYAAHAYPRTVHVIDHLPRTPSGKIQRFLLRQRRCEELEARMT